MTYDSHPETDPAAISIREARDCLIFKSTEEKYKFKIEVPGKNTYLRENLKKDLVYSDGEDDGTVFFFEKHNEGREH